MTRLSKINSLAQLFAPNQKYSAAHKDIEVA